jgi:hypothetical protein
MRAVTLSPEGEPKMNRYLSLAFFAALSSIGPVAPHTNHQPQKTIAEPQYINSFYSVDSAGKLTELERQDVTAFHTKTRALPGYATVKMLAEFKPGHSSVRLPPGARFLALCPFLSKSTAPIHIASRLCRLLRPANTPSGRPDS